MLSTTIFVSGEVVYPFTGPTLPAVVKPMLVVFPQKVCLTHNPPDAVVVVPDTFCSTSPRLAKANKMNANERSRFMLGMGYYWHCAGVRNKRHPHGGIGGGDTAWFYRVNPKLAW